MPRDVVLWHLERAREQVLRLSSALAEHRIGEAVRLERDALGPLDALIDCLTEEGGSDGRI